MHCRCCTQRLLCNAVGCWVSVNAHQCVQLWMLLYEGCRVPSSAQSAIHKCLYPMLFEAGQNLLKHKSLLLQLRIPRRQPLFISCAGCSIDLPHVAAPVRVVLCHLLLRRWRPTLCYRLLHLARIHLPHLWQKPCSTLCSVKLDVSNSIYDTLGDI